MSILFKVCAAKLFYVFINVFEVPLYTGYIIVTIKLLCARPELHVGNNSSTGCSTSNQLLANRVGKQQKMVEVHKTLNPHGKPGRSSKLHVLVWSKVWSKVLCLQQWSKAGASHGARLLALTQSLCELTDGRSLAPLTPDSITLPFK